MRSPLAAACLVLAVAAGCSREPEGPPDLLLVTVDTLRADRLACYGGPPDVGTAICGLADGGTRFAWAFSAASHTAPSMASMLTSLYPSYHAVSQQARSALRPDSLSVAQVLRRAGYHTAAFVSNPVLDRGRRFGRGFEIYDTRMPDHERNRRRAYERGAEDTTDAVLEWAVRRPRRPFFVWVHYQDPHGPYDAPGAAPVRDEPGEPTLAVLERHSGLGGIPAYQALPGLHTQAAYEKRYLDEIRYLDRHVARLFEGLEELELRPAVLFSADHGEAFGEDGFFFAHGHSVSLDQIRVPLLWRPRRPGPSRVLKTPVSLVDVAPTLLGLAGIAAPEGFQGRTLPLDAEGEAADGRPIFAEHRRRVAVIEGDAYWTREREPDAARPWYPGRSARLAGDAALPPYAPAGGEPPALEPILARFLAEAASAPPGALDAEVGDEFRAQLEALGYAE